MYNLAPVGRHHVRVCTTTPCWLRGSDEIVAACEKALAVEIGETTRDGKFTLQEVECLNACVNAPVVWIGDRFYEDLTADRARQILEALARGETPKAGPQAGRHASEPVGTTSTLSEGRK